MGILAAAKSLQHSFHIRFADTAEIAGGVASY
jgi:hypothetical protein